MSIALSETVEPLVGDTVNCKYLFPETADAKVVPEKFVELYESVSGVGLMPTPRERVLVFKRESVVVEAIVASLPAFPCGSQARITVSTKGADGATPISRPKNSLNESINPKPEAAEALPATRVKLRANMIVRKIVACDCRRFDIELIGRNRLDLKN